MLQLLAQTSSDYLYETTTLTPESDAAAGIFGAAFFIPLLVFWVVSIVAMWKLFVKAGQPGWAAIVPIYNLVVLLQVAGMPLWWLAVLVLAFVPLVGFIAALAFNIMVGMNVGRKFGKSDAWGIVLNGIFGIGYLILGFGSAKYQGGKSSTPTAAAPTA
jgi:hypothetical protein